MIGPGNLQRSFAQPASWGVAVGLLLALVTPAAPVPAAPVQPTLSLQELYRRASPAVVFITQVDASGKTTSLASGFLVSSNGIVVTNYHVIDPDQGAVHIRVKLPRGDVFTDVGVIYAEERRDFAVVTINAVGLPALPVGDSDKVEIGERVVAIGNPKGLELTLTEGIVENISLDSRNGYRFIQHQAPLSPGSSGGPLLNMRGEVIGINAFNIKDAQNLNGAIPINYTKPYFSGSARMTWEEWARTAGVAAPRHPTSPPGPNAAAYSQRRVEVQHGVLLLSLSTDKDSYGPDESVDITFTVTNTGNQDVRLDFPTTQYYDFVIKRGDTEVARWSLGQTFVQGSPPLILAPGRQLAFTTRWLQRDRDSNLLPPGQYELIGVLPLRDSPLSISLGFQKVR